LNAHEEGGNGPVQGLPYPRRTPSMTSFLFME